MEIGEQVTEMGFGVGEGVVLGNQHSLVLAVPAAGLVFVGSAEAKGEIGLALLRISVTGRSSSCLPLNQYW